MLLETCRALPGTTEDIKWRKDLIFSVGAKMYCGTGVDDLTEAAFKAHPIVFEALTARPGIIPAPYMARHHWVMVNDLAVLDADELVHLLRSAHRLVAEKLPKKRQVEMFGAVLE